MLGVNYSPFPLTADRFEADEVINNFNARGIRDHESMPANCRFLDKSKVALLKDQGFTKFICPYGILIIGSPRFPDSYMKYAANVVGHLIDPDEKGAVADPDVRDALDHSWGRILVGVISEREYQIASSVKGLELYIIKSYQTETNKARTEGQRIINEVIFKFFTRWGWAQAHR